MRVPCPVPLQTPWSPVGYQVVQVSEEVDPRQRPQPTQAKQPATSASSPVGYRVLEVADERTPVHRLPPLKGKFRLRPRPSKSDTHPAVVWGPVAAGVFAIIVCVLTVWASRPGRSVEPPSIHSIQNLRAQRPVNIPEVDNADAVVVLPPEEAGADKAKVAAVAAVNPEGAAAAKQDLLERAFPQEGCAAPRPGRETFGTAVAFARNPLEAARLAADERKLTFLLHVSGNFEDAGFT